ARGHRPRAPEVPRGRGLPGLGDQRGPGMPRGGEGPRRPAPAPPGGQGGRRARLRGVRLAPSARRAGGGGRLREPRHPEAGGEPREGGGAPREGRALRLPEPDPLQEPRLPPRAARAVGRGAREVPGLPPGGAPARPRRARGRPPPRARECEGVPPGEGPAARVGRRGDPRTGARERGSRGRPRSVPARGPPRRGEVTPGLGLLSFSLILTGASALAEEVLWTRALRRLLGSTSGAAAA